MKKKYCYIIRYTCKGALSGRAIVSAHNAKEAYQKFMKDWDGMDEGTVIPSDKLVYIEIEEWCGDADFIGRTR